MKINPISSINLQQESQQMIHHQFQVKHQSNQNIIANQNEDLQHQENQQFFSPLPKNIDYLLNQIEISDSMQNLFTQLDSFPNFIDDLRLPIKPLMPMLSQLEEYKGSLLIQTLIKDCNKKIPLFRHIRGDGNCFFRAFAFLYLETILNQEPSLERLTSLINELWKDADILDSCTKESLKVLESEEVKDFRLNRTLLLEVFKLFYNEIRQNQMTKEQRSVKLVNLFNKKQKFDVGVIMLFRRLALRAKQFYLHAMPTNDEEKAFQNELQNVGYLLEEIPIYGQEAELPIIMVLARYLHTQVEVNYLDNKNPANSIKEPEIVVVKMPEALQQCKNIQGFSFIPIIQLYYRKGHYDAGYSKEYSEEVYITDQKLNILQNVNVNNQPNLEIQQNMAIAQKQGNIQDNVNQSQIETNKNGQIQNKSSNLENNNMIQQELQLGNKTNLSRYKYFVQK